MSELSAKLSSIEEEKEGSDLRRQRAILSTKQQLIAMCFEKANEYLFKSDEKIGLIYQQLHEYLS